MTLAKLPLAEELHNMAVGFERRQASLIGAGDLPFARVTGAVPDLSSIGDIGRDMQLRARQEKAQADADQSAKQGITDTLKGQEVGAAEGQVYVGKNESGEYVNFALPDGTPEFQRGYIDGFNQTQDGKFRQSLEGRFNEIQTRVTSGELTPTDATQLMQTYVAGALENAPKHRRGSYYELGQQEIAQRSGLMTSQRAAQDAQMVADDLVAQTKADLQTATSMAAAGGDATAVYDRIDASYDQLVKLRRISLKEAENGKVAVRQYVTGQALVNRLTTALAKGEISPEQVDRFGTALDTNDPTAEAIVRRGYQVGPGAKSLVEDRYVSKDVFGKITDENARKDISLKLRTAATDYKQAVSAYAGEKAFGDQLRFLSTVDGRFASLPSDMHDEADDLMARVLVDLDAFVDPVGTSTLIANGTNPKDVPRQVAGTFAALSHLGTTKYVPKTLVATLTNMANSGDPTEMKKALDFYRAMTTLRNPAGDSVGEALRASMPDEARSFFDNLSQNVSLGYTPEDLAANFKKARGNPEMSPGALIGQYNLKVKGEAVDGDGFWSDLRTKWAYDYGQMPDPQVKDAFSNAYRQSMIMTGDPEKSFQTAYQTITSRYRKSDIVLGGIETGPNDLTNPAGYEPKTKGLFGMSRPGEKYDWINETLAYDVLEAWTTGTLVLPTGLDGEQLSQDEFFALFRNQKAEASSAGGLWNYLANPSEAFNSNFLGKTAKLMPVPGADPDQPSYAVRMFDKEGHDLGPLMIEEGGQVQPFTVNPHEDKARSERNYGVRRNLDAFEAGAIERLGTLDGKFMGKLSLEQSMGYDGTVPFGEYLDSVAPQLTKQYKLELQPVLDGLEDARKSYEDKTGEKVPRTKIDQTTLMQPRAAGFDVAAAAAATVDSVLPDGSGGTFLLRIAAQESNFGMAAGTYRLSGDKGMTQVNTGSGLKEVQRRIAQGSGRVWEAAQVLNQRLGLDLNNLTKDDLDRPIVAMAVARLYVEAVGRSVPQDLAGQAAWWKRHYNTHLGAGTAAQFVRSANKVPEDWRSRIIREG
jgi:hypothetical protein